MTVSGLGGSSPQDRPTVDNPGHVHQVHFIRAANEELVWTSGERDAVEDTTNRLREDEIIVVVKRPAGGGYAIYSLRDEQKHEQKDAEGSRDPFQLSVHRAPETLPQDLLDRHLLPVAGGPPDHLRSDASHRLYIVVSTGSGTGLARPFYDAVLRPLLEALGVVVAEGSREDDEDGAAAAAAATGYELIVTQSPHTVRDLARRLRRSTTTNTTTTTDRQRATATVVLLAGDGGVVDLLNGFADSSSEVGDDDHSSTRPTIALLPLGTGNALFHSLHKPLYRQNTTAAAVPSPYVLALRTLLLRGRPAYLPAFEARFSPGARRVPVSDDEDDEQTASGAGAVDRLLGAIVASYGFHASLVWESDTPEYRRHGAARFGMAARALLETGHAYRAVVEARKAGTTTTTTTTAAERLGRQTFGYVLVALVSNLERTFTISPASRPLGRELFLVHFGDVGAERTMEIMMAAYDEGKHVGKRWTVGNSAQGETGGGEEDGVGYDQVEEVKVTVLEEDPRWRKVCVDGAIVELERGGWMAVKKAPRALFNVLVDRSVLP